MKSRGDRSKEYQRRKRSPAYHSWNAAIQRCHNPEHRSYKHYGGRGISVCERWLGSFANFLEDMGERPEGLTLDRVDCNGNYSKENCRWADLSTQNSNRRPFNRSEATPEELETIAYMDKVFEETGLNI